jgi:hypothetical protein
MTTIPPLLTLAAGGKVRPCKAPAIRPREIELHFQVAKILREYCRPDWQWTHIGHGEARDIRTAAKLKQMGVRRGWPDFVLLPPSEQIRCLELKRIGEKLTEDQEAFRLWCVKHGVPYAIARSLDEALVTLDAWGALAIRLTGRSIGGEP